MTIKTTKRCLLKLKSTSTVTNWLATCSTSMKAFLNHETLHLPFIPSSQAALLIDGCVVTTHLVKQVCMATNGKELRLYITWGNKWTDDTFDSVDWPSLGSALQKESIADRVRLVKFIHGWFGTRKNPKRWRQLTTQKCPVCERRTETQRHILRCKHVNSVANFRLQLIQAKRFLSHCQEVMPRLWELFSQHLSHALGYGPEPMATINLNDSYGPKLAAAISEQSIIGWHNALKECISSSWGEIQADYYCERYPDTGSRPKYYCASVFQVKFIQAMWQIFQGIWKQRNAILYDEVRGSNVKLMDKRLKRIYDYKYHNVHDSDLELFRFYDLPTALQLPPFSKDQWLGTLCLAIKSCHKTLECLDKVPTHRIDCYFPPSQD